MLVTPCKLLQRGRRSLTPPEKVLSLVGLSYLGKSSVFMFNPNHASRSADNRHYLNDGKAWSFAGTLGRAYQKIFWTNKNRTALTTYLAGLLSPCVEASATTRITNSSDKENWSVEGAATLTDHTFGGVDGGSYISCGGVSGNWTNYILTLAAGFTEGEALTPSLFIRMTSGNGSLIINNPWGWQYGRWLVAGLPLNTWVRLTPISPYVTVDTAYTAYAAEGKAGIQIGSGDGTTQAFDVELVNQTNELYASSPMLAANEVTTRTDDQLRYTGLSGLTTGGALVIFRVPYASAVPVADQYHWSLNGSDSKDDGVFLWTDASSDSLIAELRSGGVSQGTVDLGAYDANTVYSVALDWDATGLRAAINTVEKTATEAVTVPASIDRMEIGRGISTDTAHGGEILMVLLFNRALTTGERSGLTGTPLQTAADTWSETAWVDPLTDEYAWTQLTADGGFPARDGAGALVYDSKLWLIGGWNPSDSTNFPRTCNNEVLNSEDGVTWTQVKANTFWKDFDQYSRAGLAGAIAASADKPYGLGTAWTVTEDTSNGGHAVYRSAETIPAGHTVHSFYAKAGSRSRIMLYFSDDYAVGFDLSDGSTFTPSGVTGLCTTYGCELIADGWYRCWAYRETSIATYLSVYGCNASAWSYLGTSKDWLIAGPQSEIGTAVTEYWEGRHTAGYCVFDNKMWIIGGDCIQGHYQYDVLNSTDGKDWTLVNGGAPIPGPRCLQVVVVHEGKIFLMGGQTIPESAPATDIQYNDVWSTVNGRDWTEECASAPWAARGMIGGGVSFAGKIWLLGGGTYDTTEHPARTYYNEVWSSPDGKTWTLECVAPWKARQYQDVCVMGGRMWIMEGFGSEAANRKDVWSSSDGKHWLYHGAVAWPARHAASLFVMADEAYLVAGNNMTADAWKLAKVP